MSITFLSNPIHLPDFFKFDREYLGKQESQNEDQKVFHKDTLEVSQLSKNRENLKIVELAKKDAKNNIYMGNEFMNLRKAEVAKVAPNRAALIGKFNQSMSSGNMGDMKEIQEADKRWLCILFGIPYEAEYQGEGTGSALHIYNEEGEEVLTYTQGVGWHEKETKAETGVHSALKLAYYEAYHDARKALNTGTNVEITNENVVVQSNFDMKA